MLGHVLSGMHPAMAVEDSEGSPELAQTACLDVPVFLRLLLALPRLGVCKQRQSNLLLRIHHSICLCLGLGLIIIAISSIGRSCRRRCCLLCCRLSWAERRWALGHRLRLFRGCRLLLRHRVSFGCDALALSERRGRSLGLDSCIFGSGCIVRVVHFMTAIVPEHQIWPIPPDAVGRHEPVGCCVVRVEGEVAARRVERVAVVRHCLLCPTRAPFLLAVLTVAAVLRRRA
mmetsp:Transcript_15316/g.30743  ORF Transcript_15316/g.30743 Transcript_15316/m.30743 type:complete len:230 (+) Transcript_15316:1480-2169(+)